MLKPEQVKTMRSEFSNLDEHHNGEISFEEFKHALERSGVEMDESSVKDLFQCIDFDRQGIIHWNEFLAATLDKNMPKLQRVGAIEALVSVLQMPHEPPQPSEPQLFAHDGTDPPCVPPPMVPYP